MDIIPTPDRYNTDCDDLSSLSYTFPSHYPSRKVAFLDYLNTVGGIDEATVDSLIMEDDVVLLVELTCWILDKLELAREELKQEQLQPPPPQQHQRSEDDNDNNDNINLQQSLYINSQFTNGTRFQTQVVIERLGINYGAIPVNDKYFGPLLSIALLDGNKSSPNRETMNFFHVLRSKDFWSNGAEFRNAYNDSPYLQYSISIEQGARNGIISPKHVPQAAPTMRIYELVFFKTFSYVPLSDIDLDSLSSPSAPSTPSSKTELQLTPPNSNQNIHSNFQSFQTDPIFLAFDRKSSCDEILSWLGLHSTELFSSPRLSYLEHLCGHSYLSICQRALHYFIYVTRFWDYYCYNYRFYELAIQIFSTGYIYERIPIEIREFEVLLNTETDIELNYSETDVDNYYNIVSDLQRRWVTDSSKLPELVSDYRKYWSIWLDWHPFLPLYALRIYLLATIYHDAPTTALGTCYLSEDRVAFYKKTVKKHQKLLQQVRESILGLKDAILHRNLPTGGFNGDDTAIGIDTDIKQTDLDQPQNVIIENEFETTPITTHTHTHTLDQYEQFTVEEMGNQILELEKEIIKLEQELELFSEQKLFYIHQAKNSYTMYEYYYSRCGFLMTRPETLIALYCLGKVKNDSTLLKRLQMVGLDDKNVLIFDHKILIDTVNKSGIFNHTIIPTDVINSFNFNQDAYYFSPHESNLPSSSSSPLSSKLPPLLSYNDQIVAMTRLTTSKTHTKIIFNFSPYLEQTFKFHIHDNIVIQRFREIIDGLTACGVPDCLSYFVGLTGKTLSDLTPTDTQFHYLIYGRPQFEMQTLVNYIRLKPLFHWHPYEATLRSRWGGTDEPITTIWDRAPTSELGDDEVVEVLEYLWQLYKQTDHYQATYKGGQSALNKTQQIKKPLVAAKSKSNQQTTTPTAVELITYETLIQICVDSLDKIALSEHYGYSREKTLTWISDKLIDSTTITKSLEKICQSREHSDHFPILGQAISHHLSPFQQSIRQPVLKRKSSLRWNNRKSYANSIKLILKTLFPLKSHLQLFYEMFTQLLFHIIWISGSHEVLQWCLSRITMPPQHIPFVSNLIISMNILPDFRDLISLDSIFSMYYTEQTKLQNAEQIKAGIKDAYLTYYSNRKNKKQLLTMATTTAATASTASTAAMETDPQHQPSQDEPENIIEQVKTEPIQFEPSVDPKITHLIRKDHLGRTYIPHFDLPYAFISPHIYGTQVDHPEQFDSLVTGAYTQNVYTTQHLKYLQSLRFGVSYDAGLAFHDNFNLFFEQFETFYNQNFQPKSSTTLQLNDPSNFLLTTPLSTTSSVLTNVPPPASMPTPGQHALLPPRPQPCLQYRLHAALYRSFRDSPVKNPETDPLTRPSNFAPFILKLPGDPIQPMSFRDVIANQNISLYKKNITQQETLQKISNSQKHYQLFLDETIFENSPQSIYASSNLYHQLFNNNDDNNNLPELLNFHIIHHHSQTSREVLEYQQINKTQELIEFHTASQLPLWNYGLLSQISNPNVQLTSPISNDYHFEISPTHRLIAKLASIMTYQDVEFLYTSSPFIPHFANGGNFSILLSKSDPSVSKANSDLVMKTHPILSSSSSSSSLTLPLLSSPIYPEFYNYSSNIFELLFHPIQSIARPDEYLKETYPLVTKPVPANILPTWTNKDNTPKLLAPVHYQHDQLAHLLSTIQLNDQQIGNNTTINSVLRYYADQAYTPSNKPQYNTNNHSYNDFIAHLVPKFLDKLPTEQEAQNEQYKPIKHIIRRRRRLLNISKRLHSQTTAQPQQPQQPKQQEGLTNDDHILLRSPPVSKSNHFNQQTFQFLKWYTTTTSIPRLYKSPNLLFIATFLLSLKTSDHLQQLIYATTNANCEVPNTILTRIIDECCIGLYHTLPTHQNSPLSFTSNTSSTPTSNIIDIPRLEQRTNFTSLERYFKYNHENNYQPSTTLHNHVDSSGPNPAGGMVISSTLSTYSRSHGSSAPIIGTWIANMQRIRQCWDSFARLSTTLEYHLKPLEIQKNHDENQNLKKEEEEEEEEKQQQQHEQQQLADENNIDSIINNPTHPNNFKFNHVYATPYQTTYSFTPTQAFIQIVFKEVMTHLLGRLSLNPTISEFAETPETTFTAFPHCQEMLTCVINAVDLLKSIQNPIVFSTVFKAFHFIPNQFILTAIKSYDWEYQRSIQDQLVLIHHRTVGCQDRPQLRTYLEQRMLRLRNKNYFKHKTNRFPNFDQDSIPVSRLELNNINQSEPPPVDILIDREATAVIVSPAFVLDFLDIYLSKHKQFFINRFVEEKLGSNRNNDNSDDNNNSNNDKTTTIDINPQEYQQHSTYLLQLLTPYSQLNDIYNYCITNHIGSKSQPDIKTMLRNFWNHANLPNNQNANYLWYRFATTLSQYPIMYHLTPLLSAPHCVAHFNPIIIGARQILLQQTMVPQLFSAILNRNINMSPQYIKFISQWNDIFQSKNSSIWKKELLLKYVDDQYGNSQNELIAYIKKQTLDENIINDTTTISSLSTKQQLNPNHHFTHFPHTPLYSNLTVLQILERESVLLDSTRIHQIQTIHKTSPAIVNNFYKPDKLNTNRFIPHIPSVGTYDPIYIDGISVLITRYANVFQHTSITSSQHKQPLRQQPQPQSQSTPLPKQYITPRQLISYIQTNLSHDLRLVQFLDISQLSADRNSLCRAHHQSILDGFNSNTILHKLSSLCSNLFSPSSRFIKGAAAVASISAAVGCYYYWYQNQTDSVRYHHHHQNGQIRDQKLSQEDQNNQNDVVFIDRVDSIENSINIDP